MKLVLIVAAMMGVACRSESKRETKPPLVGWRPIGSWSGHGNTQTESFNIEAGQWRVKWETSHEMPPGAGRFKVMVHSAVSGRPLMLAVEHAGVGRDTAYVTEDPRLYHLVIESSNIDWTVVVEEAVVSSSLPSTLPLERHIILVRLATAPTKP